MENFCFCLEIAIQVRAICNGLCSSDLISELLYKYNYKI